MSASNSINQNKPIWAWMAGAVCLWLLWLVFAHEWVVHRLNQAGAEQQAALTAHRGALTWSFPGNDVVVHGFGQGWDLDANGLWVESVKTDVSLRVNNQVIFPRWHQTIRVDAQTPNPEATAQVELSNLAEGYYYNSPHLPMAEWQQGVRLDALRWRQVNLELSSEQWLDWSELPTLETLVIRIRQAEHKPWSIQQVAVLQNAATPEYLSVNCDRSVWGCHITNAMRWARQDHVRSSDQSWLGFQSLTALPLLFWPVLLLIVAMILFIGQAWLVGMTALFTCGVLAMHFTPVVLPLAWLNGGAVVVGLAVFWWQRDALRLPRQWAMPVWLITASLAVVLWALSDWRVAFLSDLPMYFLWALLQQMLLGPVASGGLNQYIKRPEATAMLIGVMFSIVHSPNHMLMVFTFVGGVLWSWSWLRYQNLYVNAISHALLALLLYQTLPAQWLGNARVGAFF